MPWYDTTVGAGYVAPAATQIAPAFPRERPGEVQGGWGQFWPFTTPCGMEGQGGSPLIAPKGLFAEGKNSKVGNIEGNGSVPGNSQDFMCDFKGTLWGIPDLLRS